MSGGRRNRTNLNVQVDPAKVPVRQVSQPQPRSATIQHQYQPPKAVNMLNLVPEHRPMSVQYAPQDPPQASGATTQMLNGVRSPQVQLQTPRAALSTAFTAAQPRPNPPTTDFVLDRLMAALIPVLTTHRQSVATRVEKMETLIEKLTTNMKETKDETQNQTKQVVEAMQKAFAMQQAGNKALHERMAKLEKTIGAGDTGDDKKSLRNRLDAISFIVEELLERAKDPEAPGVDRSIPKTPVVPREIYVDKGIDPQTPEPRTPPPQVFPPIFVQHATSPMRQLYNDASNGPMTPAPSTPLLVCETPIRPAYVDVANDSLDLEPPAPPPAPTMQSPVRPVYIDVSVNPLTPPLPEPPRQYLSASVATSPIVYLPRLSISGSRRYSEDALTLVGDTSCVETKSACDLDEANVSPKLKRKRVKVAHDLEDDDVDIAPLEDATADTLPEGEKPDKLSSAKGVKMRSRFDASPMPSRSLSAADWSDGDRDDPPSDDDNDNTSSLPVFRPTSSPSVAKQYSLLKRRRESLDGTVASLRQDTLGDGHAIPAPSFSPQPIIPFHPRPSVSPLPSPESSPSPPPSARSRFKIRRAEIQTTTPSPERREPIIVSSPAPVSSLVLEERTATPAPVASIPSPALEQSSSSLVSAASISSPARETLAPTAEEAKLSPPSPSVQVNDLIPDSEDESELSVRRMITETFENLEPVMQPAPPPLFLPDSVSPSNSPAVPDYASPSPTPEKPPPKKRVAVSSLRSPSSVTNSSANARKSEPTVSGLKRSQVAIKKPSYPTIKIPSPQKFMNLAAPKLSPTISPKISPIITSTRPKPRRITAVSDPQLQPQPRVVVSIPSSPIYIPSRTPSPLSPLSATSLSSESDHGNDSDSEVRIIPVKKRVNLKLKIDVKPGPRASSSTSLSGGGPSSKGNANAKGGDTRPPHVDLKKKLLNKSGQSAAVTRVKKRKASSMEQTEPPLKRARQKAGADVEEGRTSVTREKRSVGASSSKGKGKEKEKGEKGGRGKGKEKGGSLVSSSTGTSTKGVGAKSRPRALPPSGCKWPEKNKTGDKKFNQQFVECDVCFLWYHYGCVGVTDAKDVRIKGGELFTCPPCSSGGANPMVPRNDNIVCARPDCGQEEKRPDEFFMTGIIGRSTRVQSGTGRRYIWLVRWDGYSIKDCTWEEEDGMTDPHSFIQHFNETAAREGIDPEENPHSTILLREAIAGGWKDPNA